MYVSCDVCRTLSMLKQFPSNVSVTAVTADYYDQRLPSALNKVRMQSATLI